MTTKKTTIGDLKKMKLTERKISVVTAYDYTMAKIADEAGIDCLLVGDSLGMVVQGDENTLNVDIDDMIYHTRCVARAAKSAHVIADMPFLSYQASHEEAVRNAGELIKAGAGSVKLEGGEEIADLVWYLSKVGIPVVAHVGLKPQSVNMTSGYKVQGKNKVDADQIFNDAQIFDEAGAAAIVLESIPLELAQDITQAVAIPTIGIGSGPFCDGQVLVLYDVLGANPDFKPRFVRQYMNLHDAAKKALQAYAKDVQNQSFPAEQESFHRNLVEVKTLNGKSKK